jgi:ribosomal-protein-alanine N-acetyltransferase
MFRSELRAGHAYLAARTSDGGLLVGYAGLAFVAGPPQAEAEVHTIGVDPAFQGRGVGRALLRGLLDVADAVGATVFLEVRTDNDTARALYESEGFTVVGLRRAYYQPSGADAHSMRRESR